RSRCAPKFLHDRTTPGGGAPRNRIGGPKEAAEAEICQRARYNRGKLLGKTGSANQFIRLSPITRPGGGVVVQRSLHRGIPNILRIFDIPFPMIYVGSPIGSNVKIRGTEAAGRKNDGAAWKIIRSKM